MSDTNSLNELTPLIARETGSACGAEPLNIVLTRRASSAARTSTVGSGTTSGSTHMGMFLANCRNTRWERRSS